MRTCRADQTLTIVPRGDLDLATVEVLVAALREEDLNAIESGPPVHGRA